jgi:UDP-glucose 4-epimerase
MTAATTTAATTTTGGVLVTGATTPFGRALVDALLARSEVASVVAVASEPAWPGAPHPRLAYVPVDLTRSRDLRDLLFGHARDREVTTVTHSAHHRSLRSRGRKAHALHVEATREMLRLAERHPTITRFVYVGAAEVYRASSELPALISEEHPLDLSSDAPQRVRDRVEADLTVCARMGLSPLSIAVLRLAEIFAEQSGSQLHDYLGSSVCYRPLGYDPMIDVISIDDAVRATMLAARSTAQGVLNVPGADVLPLSVAIERAGRIGIAVPSAAIGPLYTARAIIRGTEFDWSLQRRRFRWGGVLDGTRARELLGYVPERPVAWARGSIARSASSHAAEARGAKPRAEPAFRRSDP